MVKVVWNDWHSSSFDRENPGDWLDRRRQMSQVCQKDREWLQFRMLEPTLKFPCPTICSNCMLLSSGGLISNSIMSAVL
jgi:hypothetical protein